jgi:hypothetical protein
MLIVLPKWSAKNAVGSSLDSRRILNAVAQLIPDGSASEVFGPAVLNRGADLPFGGLLLHAMREMDLGKPGKTASSYKPE